MKLATLFVFVEKQVYLDKHSLIFRFVVFEMKHYIILL